jgi:hypothetical protein
MEKPIISLEEAENLSVTHLVRLQQAKRRESIEDTRIKYSQDFISFGEEAFGLEGVLRRDEDQEYIDTLLEPFRDPKVPRRIHVERPRETRKTLIGAQVLPVWLFAQEKLPGLKWPGGRTKRGCDLRILIISESRKLAAEALKTHKAVIESPSFIELYGNWRGDKWTDYDYFLGTRKIRTLHEPSCQAAGLDVQLTGGHFDVIIADDLVTLHNAQSIEQLQKTKLYFRYLIPLLTPSGVLICYGTRYDDEDLYGDILRHDAKTKSWKTLITPAVSGIVSAGDEGLEFPDEEDRYLFPSTLPRDVLEDRYSIMDEQSFSSQYLNECVPSSFQVFRKEHFKFIKTSEIANMTRTYFLTDTAVTEKDDGCRSVIIVMDVEPSDRRIVRDYRAGHWSPERFVDVLMELSKQYRPEMVSIEDSAANEVFKVVIDQRQRVEGVRFSLAEVKGRTNISKDRRIRSLQPRMRVGDIVFDEAILNKHKHFKDDFIHEFLFYRRTRLCDIPDALSDAFARDKNEVEYFVGPGPHEFADYDEYEYDYQVDDMDAGYY